MTTNYLLPHNEEARLRTLYRQNILNSLHEPIFTAFVELTARIFGLPISLISVTDAEETLYIAGQGISGLVQQPRVEAICALVVGEGKTIVFSDLEQVDPQRLTPESLLAARTKKLQFYAGVPLRMPDQLNIGTLCVIGQRPRVLSAQEQEVLEKLAALVARIIVVRAYCQATNMGEAHWQKVQVLLVDKISALNVLVQYIVERSGTQIPVAWKILGSIRQRLHDVEDTLDNYYYSRA